MQTYRATLLILAGVLALVGCGGDTPPPPPVATPGSAGADAAATMPEGHPPVTGAAASGGIVPPPDGAGTGETGVDWTVPDGWVEETPSSSVRRAQYRVPGADGDAEMVVFYFGPGQGGEPMANATRWANMFSQPDGSSSIDAMRTSEQNVGGLQILLVEVTGRYQNAMTGDPAIDDAMLLGAIASGPDANWFFKLTGPRGTVEAQRKAFDTLISSLSAGT